MASSRSSLPTIVLLVSLLGGFAVLLFIFGARLGIWEAPTGFTYYRQYAAYIGMAIAALSAATLVFSIVKSSGGLPKTLAALAIGLGILSPSIISTLNLQPRAAPIHDITTDTETPPAFIAIADPRPASRNDLVYGGAEEAAIQLEAYPDIKPIASALSPEEAYAEALSTAAAMKWEIIAEDPKALRFEATARTPVFYFADDIVVVVSEDDAGSRVDLRSVSRVGRSDQGVNAARIRTFSTEFGS